MPKEIKIKQENSYDWVFESEEAFNSYLDEMEQELSQDRLNNIIAMKEQQNG